MARSTFRSVSYDLDAAVALAREVERSSPGMPSEDLAPLLGYSGVKNGAFLTRLANARLFGLVTGSSSRVTLTERGRQALSEDPAMATAARIEAFLAVPLFRALRDYVGNGPLPGTVELESTLRDRFGESPAKARLSAAKLIDSARQAHFLDRDPSGQELFTSHFVGFTDFTDGAGPLDPVALLSNRGRGDNSGVRQDILASRASDADAGEVGGTMDSKGTGPEVPGGPDQSEGIWLEEPNGSGRRRGTARRRTALAAAIVVCLAVVIVPVSVALSGSGKAAAPARARITKSGLPKSDPQAVARVLSALSATTDSGSFDVSYSLTGTAATAPTPTTTQPTECNETPLVVGGVGEKAVVVQPGAEGTESQVPPTTNSMQATTATDCVSVGVAEPGNVQVTGTGVINVNPRAMVTQATVGGGLQVVVRENDTDYWEDTAASTASLAPSPTELGTGSPLDQFASLVLGTLGTREGDVAMMGLASPSGYLDLYQSEVGTANEVGPGTVNGTPVTTYQLHVSPAQEAQVTAASDEEQTTINAALASLATQGYTGTTVKISIDAEGYILGSDSTANFSDGGTADLTATFTDFGCAGTVLMPGQEGSGVPPANCTSPVPATSTPPAAPSTTAPPNGNTTTTTKPSAVPATVGTSPTTSTTISIASGGPGSNKGSGSPGGEPTTTLPTATSTTSTTRN